MANNLPRPQTIEDVGLDGWLANQGINPTRFRTLIGDDPSHPLVSKRRLAQEYNKAESTITRWLEQMKKETA